MTDVGEDIFKDAQERKLLRKFGGAELDASQGSTHPKTRPNSAKEKGKQPIHDWVRRAPELPHKYGYGGNGIPELPITVERGFMPYRPAG